MIFDLSGFEITCLGIAAYFALGKKQFIYGSSELGRFLGRSVARIGHWRSRLTNTMAKESLSSLQPELKKGFHGLKQVQSEIMSATFNPMSSVHRMFSF